MNGSAGGALALALAVAVLPSSPRRRLTLAGAVRRRMPLTLAGWTAGCAGIVVALLLSITIGLAAAVVVTTTAIRYRRRQHSRRAVAEGQSLHSAMEVLLGELRVGAHPVKAFSVAADETRGSVATALRAVAARARLGADVPAGLRSAGTSSSAPGYWDRLAVFWQLAAEHGLAMSTMMRAAQSDMAERQRFSARVTSKLAGARATSTILAGLPVLGVLLGELIDAQPLRFLLGSQGGGWLLVAGTVLACGGLLWSDRITDRVVRQ